MRQPRSCLYLRQIFTDFVYVFTDRLCNKPILIWLLTTPPHLKYVATRSCKLSLISCLLTLMFYKVLWQLTYARNGGIFNYHFCANVPRNLPVNKFCKSTKIWQNYGREFVALLFGSPCVVLESFYLMGECLFSCISIGCSARRLSIRLLGFRNLY